MDLIEVPENLERETVTLEKVGLRQGQTQAKGLVVLTRHQYVVSLKQNGIYTTARYATRKEKVFPAIVMTVNEIPPPMEDADERVDVLYKRLKRKIKEYNRHNNKKRERRYVFWSEMTLHGMCRVASTTICADSFFRFYGAI